MMEMRRMLPCFLRGMGGEVRKEALSKGVEEMFYTYKQGFGLLVWWAQNNDMGGRI
jgi:hypothetical protein